MVGNTILWELTVKKQTTCFAGRSFYVQLLLHRMFVLQVEPAQKEGISDSMKQRLLREASTGLDSDQKQTNVILYIVAAVALLVIIGGQGIFY